MKEKLIAKNKFVVASLLFLYLFLNFVLAKLLENSLILQNLLSQSNAEELFQSLPYLYIALGIVAMGLFTAVFMSFLYKNLLKFFFMESDSWETVNFCYFISITCGAVVSIMLLLFSKGIDVGILSKASNLSSVLILNGLFYFLNKKWKEQLLVTCISVLNAGFVFIF